MPYVVASVLLPDVAKKASLRLRLLSLLLHSCNLLGRLRHVAPRRIEHVSDLLSVLMQQVNRIHVLSAEAVHNALHRIVRIKLTARDISLLLRDQLSVFQLLPLVVLLEALPNLREHARLGGLRADRN